MAAALAANFGLWLLYLRGCKSPTTCLTMVHWASLQCNLYCLPTQQSQLKQLIWFVAVVPVLVGRLRLV
jgi:hypothetical protein